MSRPEPNEEVRQLAREYALGVLDESERQSFEERLRSGCEIAKAELTRAEEAVADIARGAAPLDAPPASLRERLVARIQATRRDETPPDEEVQVWKAWPSDQPAVDRTLLRASDEGFESTSYEGIRVKRLSVDRERDSVTMLIRMEPGSSYPPHRHGGTELCYVLEGDLRHDQQVMGAGDFERLEGESEHGTQWTEEGCLLLVQSSMHDELLP